MARRTMSPGEGEPNGVNIRLDSGGKSWKMRALSIGIVVTLSAVGGAFLYNKLFGNDPEPVQVKLDGPVVVKPFVPGATTCMGLTGETIPVVASRDNELDFGIYHQDITDTVHRLSGTYLYELCVKGVAGLGEESPIEVINLPDGTIEVHIYQGRGAIFKNRPAVDAQFCASMEAQDAVVAGGSSCLIMTGGPTNFESMIQFVPDMNSETSLPELTLAYGQVAAYDPTCLELAMGQADTSLPSLLYRSFGEQAELQGIDPSMVKIFLYDLEGNPTATWDSSEQKRLFEEKKAELMANLPENYEIGFDGRECKIEQFGEKITAPHEELTKEEILSVATN